VTDGGNADWSRMVMSHFKSPETEEVKAALKEFTINNQL
jgi:hypothetical protein